MTRRIYTYLIISCITLLPKAQNYIQDEHSVKSIQLVTNLDKKFLTKKYLDWRDKKKHPKDTIFIADTTKKLPKDTIFIADATKKQYKDYLYFFDILFNEKNNNDRIMTSDFGNRLHPITKKYTFHNGIDVRAKYEKLYIPFDCYVKEASYNSLLGYYVKIKIGNFQFVFGHLEKILVYKDQQLKKGQLFAISGNSGRSNAPHLHLSLKFKNKNVNPSILYYLKLDNYETI